MLSEKVKVKSGESGMSISFNPAKSKSARVNSGRNYYRTKEIWYCKNCEEEHKKQTAGFPVGKVIWWTVLFPFAFTVWLFKLPFKMLGKKTNQE